MLLLFCRCSTLKTTSKLFRHPQFVQNRRFGNDSYAQILLQYTMAYAENSLMARTFVYSYQAIGAVSCLDYTGGVIGAAIALRIITFPLYALSERLIAKRMFANQLIKRQIYEEAASHYGEKAVVDDKTGQFTFVQPTRILTNSEARKRNSILEKVEELYHKTQYEYAVENKLQLHRIFCLKICTFPLWMHTAVALRTSIDHSNAGQFTGHLWIPSFAQADPYMIFPLTFCTLSLLNLYVGKYSTKIPFQSNSKQFAFYLGNTLFCAITFGITYVLVQMPAIQSVYMSTIILTNILQTILLRNSSVKHFIVTGRRRKLVAK